MLLEQISLPAFVVNNAIKTENGKLLDLSSHKYLFDIYADNSPLLCCLKAGQIGFSTMAIVKTLWLAHNRKLNIGYILPTSEMVEKFVGSKVNMMIQENKVFMDWVKDKDSIKQKQLGKNTIFYLGSQTDRSAIMLSLDLLVGDEYDKSPQDTLETYDSRLQHSEYKWKWLFSNPTIPDFGVHKFFQQSDQKMWHINHSCGSRFIMDESCIDYDLEIYKCPKCQNIITQEEIRQGMWLPTAKGEWSGYWIPLWINPTVTAKEIAQKKHEKTAEFFANFVAGLPYIGTNNQISQSALDKCLSSEINTQENRTIIGIDTGHNIYYTLMNKQGVFYYGYCASVAENKTPGYDPYDEIDRLLGVVYKDGILVADQGGDLIGVRKLQAKYPGRVFLCQFTKATRNQQLVRWGENKEQGSVLADRNRVIQLTVDQINAGTLTINGTKEDWQPFFAHAMNIYRVKEIIGEESEPQYGWRWVWNRKGDDHWFLSLCYGLIGLDRFGEDLASFIKREDSVRFPTASTTANGIVPARRYGIRAEFN